MRKKMWSLKIDDETLAKLKQIAEDVSDGNMSMAFRQLVRRDYDARYRVTDTGRAALEEEAKK